MRNSVFLKSLAYLLYVCSLTLSITPSALSEGVYTPLVIDAVNDETGAPESFSFSVELALTNAQREQGLMNRETLGPEKGMLFIFPHNKMRSFWMRNTLIPLDIIFLDKRGKIINIVAMATPKTDVIRSSIAPAKAVLEIAGGRAAELGLEKGDTIRHSLLGNWQAH